MRHSIRAFVLILALPAIAEQPSHVVVVSVDGLMPSSYLKAGELGLKTPNLRALMGDGVWADGVIGVLPSVTYPSHTTMITGVPPAVHGIDSNKVVDPEGTSKDAWRWYAGEISAPTLIDSAAAATLTTATISWPVSVGMRSTFNVPEFWRSEHPSDLHLLAAVSTPRILERAGAYRGKAIPPLPKWTDEERVDIARYLLEKHRPQLTLLHIFDTDSAQHSHGPGSPEALAAIERADAHIGRLRDAARVAGILERTVFVIVSDHGFLPIRALLKPNLLLRDAGLITVNEKGTITDWKAYFQADGGSAALHLRDSDPATLEAVRRIVKEKAGEEASGIHEVINPARSSALGGSSKLVLDAKEGFSFSGSVTGSWIEPSEQKGTHGYAPDRPELYASLIISGPLSRRGSLGIVRMTQIAATVARFLGVPAPAGAAAGLDLDVVREETQAVSSRKYDCHRCSALSARHSDRRCTGTFDVVECWKWCAMSARHITTATPARRACSAM